MNRDETIAYAKQPIAGRRAGKRSLVFWALVHGLITVNRGRVTWPFRSLGPAVVTAPDSSPYTLAGVPERRAATADGRNLRRRHSLTGARHQRGTS